MSLLKYLLPHQLINTVSRYPDKIALIVDQHEYSYQAIYNDCLRFDFPRGGRILIQSGNSYLTVIAFWASILCEAIPCIVDPELSGDALKNLVEKLNPSAVIHNQSSDSQYDLFQFYKTDFIAELPEYKFDRNAEHHFLNTEQDLAMMMHTSGSTGDPKGVMLSHRNVLAAIESITTYLNLYSFDVILSVLPMHFDYGLYQMLLSFSSGATLILEKNMLFPNLVANKIAQYKVTVLPCVPLIVKLFYLSSERYHFDFSSLRLVTNTGESLSKNHIKKLKNLFPAAKIFSMYGLTECKRCSYVPPEMLDKKPESIGIPMPNLEMWIQDEKGNQLQPGVEGDLVISGPTVMMGYWKNTLETERKIKIHPSGKRLLMSGDRAVMDSDGYFYFKGRTDFIIKYKGAKFNCFDYAKRLSGIAEINRSHVFLSQESEDQKLIVCIEVDSDINNYDHLKRLIWSHFPTTQKPDQLYFARQFPSLSNGKLDKRTLEKKAAECI